MKVGVIGAGTMGSGIAQAFVQCEGYEVGIYAISQRSLLQAARRRLRLLLVSL